MEKVDTIQVLNVYEIIMEQGHDVEDGKVLDGVHASSGHDGYTVSLWDEYVSITINFHNTCTFNHIDKRHLNRFLDKIAFIDKVYRSRSAKSI